MSGFIDFFYQVPQEHPGLPGKIIRCFKHDDLSDWCWHGNDFSKPFADVLRSSRRWRVTHVGTFRTVGRPLLPRDLTFAEASRLALVLDHEVQGMSQVYERFAPAYEDCRIIGWDGEPMRLAYAAIERFASDLDNRKATP